MVIEQGVGERMRGQAQRAACVHPLTFLSLPRAVFLPEAGGIHGQVGPPRVLCHSPAVGRSKQELPLFVGWVPLPFDLSPTRLHQPYVRATEIRAFPFSGLVDLQLSEAS